MLPPNPFDLKTKAKILFFMNNLHQKQNKLNLIHIITYTSTSTSIYIQTKKLKQNLKKKKEKTKPRGYPLRIHAFSYVSQNKPKEIPTI